MTSIGFATLQIIPVLRGVSDAIRRETRNLSAEVAVDVDVPNADEAGRKAGAGVRRGLRESRIAAGLHREIEDELSDANASKTGSRFGKSMAAAFAVGARGMASGFAAAAGGAKDMVVHIGAIATGTRAASVATRTLARSLLVAGGSLALLGSGPLGKLALGLGFASKMAGGLARDIGRITSSLVVMMAVAKGISVMNNMARIARNITIGFAGVLGVVSGITQMIAGPLLAAVSALGAAFGVAAGAAAGLLGPVAAVAALASSGIQNAVKAYTTQQKAATGGTGAAAAASAARQVEQAEKGVARAKRDAEDAEKDLTRARKDAVEQLEDMRLALAGAALSEKDAQLGLLEAQRDLAQLGADGQSFDMIDRERAILRVQEAEQRLAEIQESNGDLSEKAAEQNEKGVEGSDEVVAAKRRVEDANAAVIESQQALTDAINASNEAAAGPAVDPFDAMIGQRMAPAIEAITGLRKTVTDNLTAARVPAFGTFAGLVDGLSPRFATLSTTLGSIGTKITSTLASPENAAALDKMFGASDSFFQRFLSGNGISGLISGLVQFSATAADTFKGFSGSIDGAFGKLGDWLRNISPAQMQLTFAVLRDTFVSIGNVVGPVFTALKDLAGISAPALAPGFQSIGQAITDATPGILQMARVLMPGLGAAMSNIAPLLPNLVDAFTPWATILGALAPVIASVVNALGPLAPIILGVAVAAKVISAGLLIWNTAMAAASIAQGVFAAATGAGTASLGTNLIALTAHRVATVAMSTATGIMTGVQWALNAALNANPIGLIVLAIAGLVAGIIYAYNHSETFRNIVQGAWAGIKTAVEAAWNFIKTNVWPGLKSFFEGIGTAAMWLWNNAIKPAWDGIKAAFSAGWDAIKFIFDVWSFGWQVVGAAAQLLWNNVIVPVWDGIKAAFNTGWSVVSNVFEAWKAAWQIVGAGAMILWHNVIEPVWNGIKTAFNAAWDFISPIFDKIGKGWDTLSGKVTSVAKAIGDGIKGAFDGVVDIMKAPLHMLGSFLSGIPGEVLGVPIPGVDTVHSWGASLQGLGNGGYTGNVGVAEAAGIVHGDEFVIKATSRRRIENAMPGLLDFLNAKGQLPLPGYAGGGRVTVDEVKKYVQSLEGGKYVLGGPPGPTGTDCSGAQAWVSNFISGASGRFATMTEDAELAKRGFTDGDPPSGKAAYWIGWKNGGPAGGHTAGTIVDPEGGNVNVEMGGRSGGGNVGAGAAGASEFPNRAWIELLGANPNGGELPPGIGGAAGGAGGIASASDIANGRFSGASVAPTSSSGTTSREIPTSISGLAGMPFAGLSAKTRVSPASPEREFKFGDAIASGVSGQVSSALGVLGINDSPPILKAASMVLGGISIGGKKLMDFGGGGAGPLAGAAGGASGVPQPGSNPAHLNGGNPGPGNVTNWNIQTATVQDAFMQAQQKEREAAAARLQRF